MSTGIKLSELSERQLFALRRRLASGVHDPVVTLRGALHHDLRRCSSENCRCRSGELHGPYAYLTVYGDGRSRTVYVPQALAVITSEQVEATPGRGVDVGDLAGQSRAAQAAGVAVMGGGGHRRRGGLRGGEHARRRAGGGSR